MDIPSSNSRCPIVEIIGGMALVNAIEKTGEIKTCKDFSNAFNKLIMLETGDSDEIRVLFDRYVSHYLKAGTREKRCAGNVIKYKVNDTTNIEGVSMKSFLSHIETKHELTEYLAKNLINQFLERQKLFAVTYHNISISNIPEDTIPN